MFDRLLNTPLIKLFFSKLLIKRQSCHNMKPIQLMFRANQLTGFYMLAAFAFNELNRFLCMTI